MRISIGLGLGSALPATVGLSGIWVASATPVDSTRTGFDTDTVLSEFGSAAAPERTDAISTSLELNQTGGTVTGTYTDAVRYQGDATNPCDWRIATWASEPGN